MHREKHFGYWRVSYVYIERKGRNSHRKLLACTLLIRASFQLHYFRLSPFPPVPHLIFFLSSWWCRWQMPRPITKKSFYNGNDNKSYVDFCFACLCIGRLTIMIFLAGYSSYSNLLTNELWIFVREIGLNLFSNNLCPSVWDRPGGTYFHLK